MTKKIKEKKDFSNNDPLKFRRYITQFLLAFVVFLTCIGIYVYFETYQENVKVVQKQQTASSEELMRKMKQMLEDEKMRLASLPPVPDQKIPFEGNMTSSVTQEKVIEDNTSKISENEHKAYEFTEARDYENNIKEEEKKQQPFQKKVEVPKRRYPQGTTPKLAIIIDDVSFPWQTRLMKEIPYKITPAFFPPTAGHPETVRLSGEFPFAMIHLPMESKNYARPEEDTLNIVDSEEVIAKRIKRIKKLFPNIVYYNNHTGGYFTSNYEAMDKLVGIMKSENLIFVDSRTAPNSKAYEVTRKHNMEFLSRDVFLDNSITRSEIREQLRKAVAIARKNGSAIAIGHPHKITLETLRDSKDILEGIDMVYVKDL